VLGNFLTAAGLVITVLLAIIAWQRRQTNEVERRSFHRHEEAKEEIAKSETRSTEQRREVEARLRDDVAKAESRSVQAIKDAELRCEKSDARILETVNSQYSELRRDLRDGMKELRDTVSNLAKEH
jgi:cytoskeletal protein RodZ